MYVKAFVLCLAFFSALLPSSAQVSNVDAGRIPIADLNGPWRFHTGDAAAWADPGFDDSGWSLLTPAKSYDEQGYHGYAGVSWYRLGITVPNWPEPLALYFPFVGDSFQVYADGKLIGEMGGMPPEIKPKMASKILMPIPSGVASPGKSLMIAVRVWRWDRLATYTEGGLGAPPRIGSLAVLAQWQQLEKHELYWSQSDAVMSFLANILTALAGLALFLLRPKEREYLWFGIAQVFWSLQSMIHVLLMSKPVEFIPAEILLVCSMGIAMFFNLEFFVTLMRQRKRFRYWIATVAIVGYVLLLAPIYQGWISDIHYVSTETVLELMYGICVTALIYGGARQGSTEAKLLLVPFTLSFLCNVINPLVEIPALSSQPWVQRFSAHFQQLISWPFPMRTVVFAGNLALFSVVAVLVLRFARSRRDEERLSAELEAARAVQHVLLPEEIPSVPGFQIECVYKPAGDVGGDFFQILPRADGNALVVIGDVSGKGMPAAMTVSLLVGMVRMLARTTQSPAEILAAINQNMMGRTSGGFTTCLILNVKPNGAVTAANAGHVPPYVNGHELRVESGLPLGLDVNAAYTETSFELAPAEQVTLLTDGVVEARTANGELFGFERAASMSAQPAAKIAAAAQQFGQEDDITVLSLTRDPSGKKTRNLIEPSAWSTASA